MSKTDKTRPWWVQTADPSNRRRLIAVHHHWAHDHYDPELNRHLVVRSAPCDLGERESRCRWWPRGWNMCGCPICTDQDGRRRGRRRERAAGRRECRDYTDDRA